MSSFLLLEFALYIATSFSQSTICVWNALDSWDHLNGVYTLSGTHHNQPYWQKSGSQCESPSYYVEWIYDSYGWWWMINKALVPQYVNGQPYCENSNPVLANGSIPSQCNNWWVWFTPGNNYGLSFDVTNGDCPDLVCEKILLSNTGESQCSNKIFTKNVNYNNVYQNGATYMYFNEQTFKWYCSDTLGVDECEDDGTITHYHIASNDDGWNDVLWDNSFQLPLDNGYTATFNCIGPTSTPTTSPSNIPTLTPSDNPTGVPSHNPTAFPTNPTISPTNPTAMPSMIPSNVPSNVPSAVPSNFPSKIPSLLPSNIPSFMPSNVPSVGPTTATTYTTTAATGTKETIIIIPVSPTIAPTDDGQSVDDETTYLPTVDDAPASDSFENNDNSLVSDDMLMLVIAGGVFLVVFQCICLCVFLYYRKRKRGKSNDQQLPSTTTSMPDMIKVGSQSTFTNSSLALGEFCAATTPNLAALNNNVKINSTSIGMKKFDLNTNGMDITEPVNDNNGAALYGRGNGITPMGDNNQDFINNNKNESGSDEGDDDMYTINRQATIGGPQEFMDTPM